MKPLKMHAQRLRDLQISKLSIRLKSLETAYNIGKVFESIKTLKHSCDGVVFTSRTSPYVFGTCSTM